MSEHFRHSKLTATAPEFTPRSVIGDRQRNSSSSTTLDEYASPHLDAARPHSGDGTRTDAGSRKSSDSASSNYNSANNNESEGGIYSQWSGLSGLPSFFDPPGQSPDAGAFFSVSSLGGHRLDEAIEPPEEEEEERGHVIPRPMPFLLGPNDLAEEVGHSVFNSLFSNNSVGINREALSGNLIMSTSPKTGVLHLPPPEGPPPGFAPKQNVGVVGGGINAPAAASAPIRETHLLGVPKINGVPVTSPAVIPKAVTRLVGITVMNGKPVGAFLAENTEEAAEETARPAALSSSSASSVNSVRASESTVVGSKAPPSPAPTPPPVTAAPTSTGGASVTTEPTSTSGIASLTTAAVPTSTSGTNGIAVPTSTSGVSLTTAPTSTGGGASVPVAAAGESLEVENTTAEEQVSQVPPEVTAKPKLEPRTSTGTVRTSPPSPALRAQESAPENSPITPKSSPKSRSPSPFLRTARSPFSSPGKALANAREGGYSPSKDVGGSLWWSIATLCFVVWALVLFVLHFVWCLGQWCAMCAWSAICGVGWLSVTAIKGVGSSARKAARAVSQKKADTLQSFHVWLIEMTADEHTRARLQRAAPRSAPVSPARTDIVTPPDLSAPQRVPEERSVPGAVPAFVGPVVELRVSAPANDVKPAAEIVPSDTKESVSEKEPVVVAKEPVQGSTFSALNPLTRWMGGEDYAELLAEEKAAHKMTFMKLAQSEEKVDLFAKEIKRVNGELVTANGKAVKARAEATALAKQMETQRFTLMSTFRELFETQQALAAMAPPPTPHSWKWLDGERWATPCAFKDQRYVRIPLFASAKDAMQVGALVAGRGQEWIADIMRKHQIFDLEIRDGYVFFPHLPYTLAKMSTIWPLFEGAVTRAHHRLAYEFSLPPSGSLVPPTGNNNAATTPTHTPIVPGAAAAVAPVKTVVNTPPTAGVAKRAA